MSKESNHDSEHDANLDALAFIRRVFSLPTVQQAVYDVEGEELGRELQAWLDANEETYHV